MNRILVGLVVATALWLLGVVAIASTPPRQSPMASHPRAMPADIKPCLLGICW
jgi:hypothetical protein